MSCIEDKILCGKCQSTFFLSSINDFINHKLWCSHSIYGEKKSDTGFRKTCAHCIFSSEDWEILFEHLQNVHGLHLLKNNQMNESQTSTSSYTDSPVDFNFQSNIQSPETPVYLSSQYTNKYDILPLDSNNNPVNVNTHSSNTSALNTNQENQNGQFLRSTCCMDDGTNQCDQIAYCPRLFGDKSEEKIYETPTVNNSKRVTPVFISRELAQSDYNTELGEIKDPETSSNEDTKSKYMCKHCFKPFKQKVHMRKHEIVMHGGERPFKCSYCSYKSVDSSHLRVHMRKHTGERPFQCHVCEFKAAQNSTLKQHCAVKHPNSLFSCRKCNTKLFTKYENEKHLNSCDKSINYLHNESSQISLKNSI